MGHMPVDYIFTAGIVGFLSYVCVSFNSEYIFDFVKVLDLVG